MTIENARLIWFVFSQYVQLFAIPWTASCQVPQSSTVSQIVHWVSDTVYPYHSVVPFSSCLLTFLASGSFPTVTGRGTPSRAGNWALVYHSEMNCLRRHMCWQSKRFYWEGHPGGEQEGEGTQENCFPTVLSFMVMGLVSGWSLANHSNSESSLVAHASLSQDGC